VVLKYFLLTCYIILQCFQSKVIRTIVEAPWYGYLNDLQTPTVKEEIHRYSSEYSAHLSAHENELVVNLNVQTDNIW
jgi:hypothetical protein